MSLIKDNFIDNALKAVTEINGIEDNSKKEVVKDDFKKSLIEKQNELTLISNKRSGSINNLSPLLEEIEEVIKSLSETLNNKDKEIKD